MGAINVGRVTSLETGTSQKSPLLKGGLCDLSSLYRTWGCRLELPRTPLFLSPATQPTTEFVAMGSVTCGFRVLRSDPLTLLLNFEVESPTWTLSF